MKPSASPCGIERWNHSSTIDRRHDMSAAKQPRQESKGYAERLSGELKPTPNGSTYVKPDAMEWKPSQFEGVEIKVLYENKEAGEMTCLLRWHPGTPLPFHKPPEVEQSW